MYHKYLSTLLFTLICLLIFLTHPIKTLAQTSLQISNISDNRSNYPNQEIPKYEKFEVTFNINDTVATNFQFPYDGQVVPNLINRVGITVDGLFLPPGESDWNNALVQPGFLYQPTLRDSNVGEYDWIYPTGEVYWILRFSPKQQGAWKYKIRAQDDSICSGANPCNNWVESPEYQFTATGSLPNNNGFVEVSPYDSRYFMFSDESQFFGLGHAGPSLTPLKSAETYLEEQNQKDVDVIRAWMSASLIVSRGTHWWDPWREVRWADQITADAGVPGVPYGDHDLAVKIGGNGDYIFMTADGNQYISTGLEANKDYIIRIRAKLENVTPSASGSGLKGLVAKVVNNPDPCAAPGEPNFGCNFLNQGNTLLYLTPTAEIGTSDWHIFEGRFRNTFGRIVFQWGHSLTVGLQNVDSGTVYLDEVYIGEDLGNNQIGPNVVFKGQLNYHLYFDQIASGSWDRVIDKAKKEGVYLKLVVLDNDDWIYRRLNNYNFYAADNTQVGRLQTYFWRYLAARWGYATSIHSWELNNEGDPFSSAHYDMANRFAQTLHQLDKNHLTNTSFWHSFPTSFWQSTDLDYADLHAYVSTSYAPLSERAKMTNDAAYYRIWHSQDVFNRNPNKPVIRGEAGLDFPTQQIPNSELQQDTQGVWFHNYLWSGLDSGGMYELYWYNTDYYSPGIFDHRDEYGRIKSFLTGLDLHKGGYINWGGSSTDTNLRIVGQKNTSTGKAHLWIQNKVHTWKNVVDGVAISPITSTVTVPGFSPNTSYPIEWWDTYTGVPSGSESLQTDSSGNLSLSVINLTSDIAVKIGDYTIVTPTPSPTAIPGDANNDGVVDGIDYVIWLNHYNQSTLNRQSDGDFNSDGKVDGIDYVIWLNNYNP